MAFQWRAWLTQQGRAIWKQGEWGSHATATSL